MHLPGPEPPQGLMQMGVTLARGADAAMPSPTSRPLVSSGNGKGAGPKGKSSSIWTPVSRAKPLFGSSANRNAGT